jgi:lipopolysaccharide biosynthesis glycosyltransferase
MKTCAVTAAIWTPAEYIEALKRVTARFEQLNDMEVRVMTDKDLHGKFLSSNHYARYHAWNFVPSDIERIVYFDIDIIPLRPLPELPKADLCATRERDEIFKQYSDWWPVVGRAGMCFNSGLVIATRKTENIFQRMLLRQHHGWNREFPWVDQPILNVEVFSAVEAGEITFKEIPRSWNSLILVDDEPEPDDPYILHLAGGKASKMHLVQHVLDQIAQIERLIDIKKRYTDG